MLSCLFQFDYCAGIARRSLRRFLLDLYFINDKIAWFDLPALEIDTETNGLFLIRGLTFSLSTFTAIAHGIEVGVKLSPDMELAIQVEEVTVSLFRKIEVGDVYANIKGGDWEMTFDSSFPHVHDSNDDSFIARDTHILRAASVALDGTFAYPSEVKDSLTGGKAPQSSSDTAAMLNTVTQISPDDAEAKDKYNETVDEIRRTVTANIARDVLLKATKEHEDGTTLDLDDINDLRAAICGHIHEQPSIPHPPTKSIRLSTLRKNNHPKVKAFIHRLPLLYRMLLSPIAYFHPVNIRSITAAGSGKWFVHLMQQYFFKHYSTQDQDVRRLETRLSAWLADANFAAELSDIRCTAQVPMNPIYDIECHFKFDDVMVYRTLPMAASLVQVVRLGGADATIAVPSFLLPHHGHLLPEKQSELQEMKLEQEIADMEDTPKEIQAQAALEQLRKDEANVIISAHAHLPAKFHQDLLNFIAAIVKATKIIETDKDMEQIKSLREMKRIGTNLSETSMSQFASPVSDDDASSIRSDTTIDPAETKGFKNFLKKMDTGFKDASAKTMDGMRKAGLSTASAMANDRWIAKMVGKVLRKLEKAQGDVGYSGNLPVSLEEYRERAALEPESKLLP
jgi:hypothetical protein